MLTFEIEMYDGYKLPIERILNAVAEMELAGAKQADMYVEVHDAMSGYCCDGCSGPASEYAQSHVPKLVLTAPEPKASKTL